MAEEIKNNQIWTDGVCVYVSAKVSNPILGKIALVIADAMILSVAILAIKIRIPGLLLFSMLPLFFLAKYTLWNFFGRETLIINTKSFSYQHDYGVIKMAFVTKKIANKIIVKALPVETDDTENPLQLSFISYHKENDIPFEVYHTSLYFSEKEAIYINSLIQQLFIDELSKNNEFPAVYLN